MQFYHLCEVLLALHYPFQSMGISMLRLIRRIEVSFLLQCKYNATNPRRRPTSPIIPCSSAAWYAAWSSPGLAGIQEL